MEPRVTLEQPQDVSVQNEGTLFLFTPHTERAKQFIAENVIGETTYFGNALVVEPRYARDLASGMIGDGLKLQ